jgi:hypothetical protein
MRTPRKLFKTWLSVEPFLILLVGFSAPSQAHAQQGENAIYNSSSACCQASTAFLDATAFCATPGSCSSTDDLCAVTNEAIHLLPTTGGIVDARGVNPGSNNICGHSLYSYPTSITTPSTVLLPPGTIYMEVPWIMPNGSRIVGTARKTTIIPCSTSLSSACTSNFTADATDGMIEMGSSSLCSTPCTNVAVEHVLLEGNNIGPALTGIYNSYSGDGSYVNDVVLKWLEGNGILVTGTSATGSGPYSNLDYEAGGEGSTNGPWSMNCGHVVGSLPCEQTSTACVQLLTPTRGVHGITCTANGVPNAAIYIGSNGNTVEDVHVEGHVDSVRIGDNALTTAITANAAGATILDITSASGGNTSGNVKRTIHICAPGSSSCSSNAGTVGDVNVVQASIYTTAAPNTVIQDDVSSTTLEGSASSPGIAHYELGQPLAGGHTMIAVGGDSVGGSISTLVPVWGVAELGDATSPTTPCQSGAILSNTTGTSPGSTKDTIWLCEGGSWVGLR